MFADLFRPAFVIPPPDKRTTIVGRTGSGKTQAGSFILANENYDVMPWVILDFKREALFAEIGEHVREISLTDRQSWQSINQPGLYVVRPMIDQEDEVEEFLWFVWDHEHCGVFIDEGYMIGKSKAYIGLLTQGRSKLTPVITLTQRPVFVTQFAFSEADYFMIFKLSKPEDRKRVQDFVDRPLDRRLPEHESYWYDVNQDRLVILRPVPSREVIISTFRTRLEALNAKRPSKHFV